MKKESHLYVHIPFCRHRCDYCSFYSVDDFRLKKRYIEALKKDIKMLASNYDVSLKTLYFGGGSPAVLRIEELSDILGEIAENFELSIEEFTIELNPHQVRTSYLKGLRELGVNRISLGVQSFSQSYLDDIGRKARVSKSEEAYHVIREMGFDNISLDLIYGGPKSSIETVKKDLDKFISLNPEHISTYCLSVDEGCALDARLKTGLIRLPEEDNVAEQLEFITKYLVDNGYNRYEISNYAKEKYESRHNMAYWKYKDSLAVGASAVYTYDNKRVENYPDINKYVLEAEAGHFPLGEVHYLDKDDKFIEFLIMGLRLKEGISLSKSMEEYGVDISTELREWIDKYTSFGLMIVKDDTLHFTDRGLNVSNLILSELF